MFKKVSEIPNTNYDEMLINFLKDYTISAMMNYTTREREGSGNIFQDAYKWLQTKKTNSERLKYFNLDKFWDIANDDAITKPKIKEMAVNSLIDILGFSQCPLDSKIHYLKLSVQNMIDGSNFIEHCKLFMSIASKFNLNKEKEFEAFHKINHIFGGLITLIIQKHESIISASSDYSKLRSEDQKDEMNNELSNELVNQHKMLYTESLNVIKFIL